MAKVHHIKNTLAREGITASQKESGQEIIKKPQYFIRFGAIKPCNPTVVALEARTNAIELHFFDSFLPRNEWTNLGNGWYQITDDLSGKCTHCGLQTVIDCVNGSFCCIYEPQTISGWNACGYSNAEYTLSVDLKCSTSQTNGCCIVFAFKDITKFCVLICDIDNHSWEIGRFSDGNYYSIAEKYDDNIKSNRFLSVFLQVRQDCVSIDVGGSALFTSMKVTDDETALGGLVGILAKQCKCMIKGWKLSKQDHITSLVNMETQAMSVSENYSSSRNTAPRKSATRSLADILQSYQDNGRSAAIERIGPPPAPIGGGGPNSSYASNGNEVRKSLEIRNPRSLGISEDTVLSSGPSPLALFAPKYNPATINPEPGPTPPTTSTDLSSFPLKPTLDQGREYLLGNAHPIDIVDGILRDIIFPQTINVSFEDIGALEKAKQLLNEAIVLPIILPQLFTGICEPWKGVLLFGPPGTGKTLLARAVAGLSASTFLNCSSSTILCKYRGDSEKTLKCLFEAAKAFAPSIVFIDEVDGVATSRGMQGEHEASRRMKTELFTQMDGLTAGSGARVLVLATTNCPWDLDEALRRRFEKRIYISLPDNQARIEVFKVSTKSMNLSYDNLESYTDCSQYEPEQKSPRDILCGVLASMTEGYSGADIVCVCREAAMLPLRQIMKAIPNPLDLQKQLQSGAITNDQLSTVKITDFITALKNVKSTVAEKKYITKFENWNTEFGSS